MLIFCEVPVLVWQLRDPFPFKHKMMLTGPMAAPEAMTSKSAREAEKHYDLKSH